MKGPGLILRLNVEGKPSMGGIHKFNQLGSFDQCTRTDLEVTFVHDHYDLRKNFPS